jgi:hypothetical protein
MSTGKAKRPANRTTVMYVGCATTIIFVTLVLFGWPKLWKDPGSSLKPPKALGDCSQAAYYVSDVLRHSKCSLSDPDSNDIWIVVDGKVYDVSAWGALEIYIHRLFRFQILTIHS